MKNRRSDDMIDKIKAFNEFHIKKGASANAPFLKLQRSNYTLIRERECNWKYFQQLCRKRFAANGVNNYLLFVHCMTEFVKNICSRKGCSLMANNAKRKIVGWIFRAWVTRKDGTRDWARDRGLKAWRIPVYAK
jgi:hypothetical protein